MNRKKIEPLGVDPGSDDAKKGLPRKECDRKLVRKAYSRAVMFQARMGAMDIRGNSAVDLLSEVSSEESE